MRDPENPMKTMQAKTQLCTFYQKHRERLKTCNTPKTLKTPLKVLVKTDDLTLQLLNIDFTCFYSFTKFFNVLSSLRVFKSVKSILEVFRVSQRSEGQSQSLFEVPSEVGQRLARGWLEVC